MAQRERMRFALAGNPNSGKTTLFNVLTGSTAHVGNWPGVTVEKKDGVYKNKVTKEEIYILDLPGIYSLSPYTSEEVISRNAIIDEKIDLIINIVDATNLERNLYLTSQLLEMDLPVVIALNMIDEVNKEGDSINVRELENKLRVPVVEISALKEENISLLMDRAIDFAKKKREGMTILKDSPLKNLINEVTESLKKQDIPNPLFHALKIIENDELETNKHPDVYKFVKEYNDEHLSSQDLEAMVADERYKYITSNLSNVYSKKDPNKKKLSKSDKIDKVLTNKWLGIPIFIAILFVIFHLTFAEDFLYLNAMGVSFPTNFAGTPFEGLFFTEGGINSIGVILQNLVICFTDWINSLVGDLLTSMNASNWGISLVCDGILGGLFSVLSFVPQILLLFLFFSILEDTGYMARVAFILDRIFRKFGVSGRAFMPMIMGFGCSVPAMINTRTLSDEKEKIATIRVIPFFSCGAKLPILTACIGAIIITLGVGNADLITLSMYLLGMVTAIVALIIMKQTTLKGEVAPFIMELPNYHLPQFKSLMIHLWDKLKHFIEKAFTIILISTIVIWFLQSFTFDWKYIEYDPETLQFLGTLTTDDSILAGIGKLIQPLFTPLGFGSQLAAFGWVFAVGAITGLIAKENVIATFGMLAAVVGVALGSAEGEGVNEVVAMVQATNITIPALISFIAFNMLTIPCFAAVATAKAELKKGTLKYTIAFWLIVSYTVSSLIYTVGSWWWTSFIWVGAIALIIVGIYLYNKKISSSRLTLKQG